MEMYGHINLRSYNGWTKVSWSQRMSCVVLLKILVLSMIIKELHSGEGKKESCFFVEFHFKGLIAATFGKEQWLVWLQYLLPTNSGELWAILVSFDFNVNSCLDISCIHSFTCMCEIVYNLQWNISCSTMQNK